jgi:hypothetical protein
MTSASEGHKPVALSLSNKHLPLIGRCHAPAVPQLHQLKPACHHYKSVCGGEPGQDPRASLFDRKARAASGSIAQSIAFSSPQRPDSVVVEPASLLSLCVSVTIGESFKFCIPNRFHRSLSLVVDSGSDSSPGRLCSLLRIPAPRLATPAHRSDNSPTCIAPAGHQTFISSRILTTSVPKARDKLPY